MASGLTRPLVRSLKGRMYSAAAAQKVESSSVPQDREPKAYIKRLNNGMLVGTIETYSPVARVAVVANAGARNENGDNLGVTHFLRHAPQLRTENMSSLGILRSALQLGSDITCESSREYLVYRGNVTRNCAGKVVEILRELSTKQVYKPWEVSDVQADPNGMRLELQLLKTQPLVRLQEQLHAAAFRDTLGRSLYAPEFMLGKYNPEQLYNYTRTYFGAGRLALVGVGIDHQEMEEYAAKFDPIPASGVNTQPAKYAGGEIRENTGGDLAYAAVALSGPSLTSNDLLPAEVLKHVLGTGPTIKYGNGNFQARLGKAVAQACHGPFYVAGLNVNYSDAGLTGFTAIAPSGDIDKVVRSAAAEFMNILNKGLTDAEVSRAKNQLKAEICMQFENPDVLLGWLGEQTLHSESILTPQEVYKLVDPITTANVNSVLKKIAASRPSMAATGNTSNVPYLDQLLSK